MKELFFIFTSTLFILSACSTKSEQSPIDLFSKKVKIKSQKIDLNTDGVAKGGRMLFFEQQLIIHDWSNPEQLILKIPLNKAKQSTHYLSVGNGPSEFIHLNLGQKLSDSTVLIQDIDRGPIYEMNIHTGNLSKILDYQGYKCLNIIQGENQYIGTGIFSEGMFAIWDNRSLTPTLFTHHYPIDNIEGSAQAKAMAYQGKMSIKKSLDYFIFASSNCAYFEIFKIKTSSFASIYNSTIGTFNYTPSRGNDIYAISNKDNKQGYIDIYTTEKYIYLLYSGRKSKNGDIKSIEKSVLGNHILVFTWDGKPVIQYETDLDLKNICVSDSDQTLYAITYAPDPQIVSFNIHKIIEQ